jgi:hypothetical protein
MSHASSVSWDESCHEMFFPAIKDRLNELYAVTGIKLS